MNKLAKLKYLPNNFDVIEEGDHVICSVSGKKIPLQNLNYWNISNVKYMLEMFHDSKFDKDISKF